jgi:hypothetical protein
MKQHDEPLVTHYVRKVHALGVRAHDGENVEAEVEAAVREACEHFAVWKTGRPAGNRARLRSLLKLQAEATHKTQPRVKETLARAASLVAAD